MFCKSILTGMFLIFLSFSLLVQAHEGHRHKGSASLAIEADFQSLEKKTEEPSSSLLASIGRFHLLFLHFPIALIVMTVVAELLWIWFATPLFTHAARFMILTAAIFALPTALLGWALSSGQHYEGVQLDLFVWHRYFGFLTAGLAIFAAILRERCTHEKTSSVVGYYLCLFFLFLSVSFTGAFGGSLAFGLDVW